MVDFAQSDRMLRLGSTCDGEGGPPGRLRWSAIALQPQPLTAHRWKISATTGARSRVGHEPGLGVAGAGAAGDGVGEALERVAVGGASAAAVALQRVLAHPALGLARELRALVLVERLLQRDQQSAFGGAGIARAERVVDLDAVLAQLAVKQPGGDAVAGEAGGLVDHDRVEAPRAGGRVPPG